MGKITNFYGKSNARIQSVIVKDSAQQHGAKIIFAAGTCV